MKFAAAILALLILLTAAYPVPSQLPAVKKVKCHMMANHCKKMGQGKKQEGKKDDCNSGGCNPFSICNYFPVITSLFPVSPEARCIIVSQRFHLFNDDIYSGYRDKCWHPPQHS
jgi:hypothetical protein